MNPEPRCEDDYPARQVEAAHRVLVDLGQVLASFRDCFVVVGGWAPDLLAPEAEPRHIGSIDVDLALDAQKLNDGRYAELLKLLLDTGRYRQGDKPFQLSTDVALDDGDASVRVDVEFLAPTEVRMEKHHPKLVEGFRVFQFSECALAFQSPFEIEISGKMATGAENRVRVRVASLPDFTLMKTHAIRGRDKPKDVYDLCFCLDQSPGGIAEVGKDWRRRHDEPLVREAIDILREKFETVNHFGPRQLAAFHDSQDPEEDARHARRAYELVQALLRHVTE